MLCFIIASLIGLWHIDISYACWNASICVCLCVCACVCAFVFAMPAIWVQHVAILMKTFTQITKLFWKWKLKTSKTSKYLWWMHKWITTHIQTHTHIRICIWQTHILIYASMHINMIGSLFACLSVENINFKEIIFLCRYVCVCVHAHMLLYVCMYCYTNSCLWF